VRGSKAEADQGECRDAGHGGRGRSSLKRPRSEDEVARGAGDIASPFASEVRPLELHNVSKLPKSADAQVEDQGNT
jgi:hypothetical protein